MSTTIENQNGQESALMPATQQTGALQVQERKAPMAMAPSGIQFSDFEQLFRFAICVSKSGLAPKGIQTPEAIAIAVQMGLEVGLSPMAALQNIAVINGRPSIWGDAQLAIVRSSGQLARFEESETNNASDLLFRELCLTDDPQQKKLLRLQIAKAQSAHNKNADDFGVTTFVQRKGFEATFTRFTVSDAKVAKLWAKLGPWTDYPPRMLKFRARSFGLRDQFGDALKGMLSAEEAQDIPAIETARPVLGIVAPQPRAQIEDAAINVPIAPPLTTTGPKLTILTDWMAARKFSWSQLQPILVENGILPEADSISSAEELNEAQAAKVHAARSGLETALDGGAK